MNEVLDIKMPRHMLALQCEMFSITLIVTGGQVEEDALRDLYARQI